MTPPFNVESKPPDRRRSPPILLLLLATAWSANHFAALLPVLRQQENLSTGLLAGVYALYAVGLLPGLLAGGTVSDRIGRPAVALPGAALTLTGTICLLFWQDPTGLTIGRLIIGLGAGATFSAGTAWAADLAGATGATQAGLALTIGLAVAPAVTGVLAQWFPAPLTTPFIVSAALSLFAILLTLRRLPQLAPAPPHNLADDPARRANRRPVPRRTTYRPIDISGSGLVTTHRPLGVRRRYRRPSDTALPNANYNRRATTGGGRRRSCLRQWPSGTNSCAPPTSGPRRRNTRGSSSRRWARARWNRRECPPHPTRRDHVSCCSASGTGSAYEPDSSTSPSGGHPNIAERSPALFYLVTYLGFGVPPLLEAIRPAMGATTPLLALAGLAGLSSLTRWWHLRAIAARGSLGEQGIASHRVTSPTIYGQLHSSRPHKSQPPDGSKATDLHRRKARIP